MEPEVVPANHDPPPSTVRRLKIAFVVHDYCRQYGQGRYVVELATRFRNDHEVHVFANTADEMELAGITCHHVPAWRRNALSTIISFIVPATLQISKRFDVVHAQGLCGLRQNVITAHICSAAWFGAIDSNGGVNSFRKKIFRGLVLKLERLVMRRGAALKFIAVSERLRKDLARHHGLEEDVSVIHHGVDTDTFHPENRDRWRRQVRIELGCDDSEFVPLYVGDWQKVGATLVAAIARAPRVKMVVVSASAPAVIRRDAASAGVAERLVLVPPTRQVERYYAAADAFLFPTIYDTFGMVVAEAMATALPVVTSRAAGAAELIVHERNGLLLDVPSDAETLALQIGRLRDDEELRRRLGTAARATAETLTWDTVAQQTMAVYREVVATRRP